MNLRQWLAVWILFALGLLLGVLIGFHMANPCAVTVMIDQPIVSSNLVM